MTFHPVRGQAFQPPGLPATQPRTVRARAFQGRTVLAALLTGVGLLAPPPPQTDLDAFMQKVLAKRDENWKKLQQYVLDETEKVDVRGPSNIPVWGEKREYTWYLRDGYFIRSPTKADGVTVSEADRRKYEDAYLRRVKARDKRGERGRVPEAALDASEMQGKSPTDVEALIKQSRQPEFIDSAYFLRFKFEQGKYALVGREKFNDKDVLRIEYYPARLFSHEQDKERQAAQNKGKAEIKKVDPREQKMEAQMERMMNKVSLVTLWVEPAAHQIVRYTFDNVNFDFLPAAWLLRVDDLKASMTMSQAIKDVWLPHDVEMYFSSMLAIGGFNVRYHLDYSNYKEATTAGRIKGGGFER